MAGAVKRQNGEDFSPAQVEKVIALLAEDKPITKKAACAMLNMSYNTTRLQKVLDEYVEDKERRIKMRRIMRTKPLDPSTLSEIVSSYLSGESLADIAESTYRSTSVVKNVLTRYNVPIRNKSVDYINPVFIADDAIMDDYAVGDLVYAARYDAPATIQSMKDSEKHGMVYQIWIHSLSKYAYQPYYELADLRRVQNELKIKMHDMSKDEVRQLINEGLSNQKKQLDKRK